MSEHLLTIPKHRLPSLVHTSFIRHNNEALIKDMEPGDSVKMISQDFVERGNDEDFVVSELGKLPDQITKTQLLEEVTSILKRCKTEAWRTCPPELIASRVAF